MVVSFLFESIQGNIVLCINYVLNFQDLFSIFWRD